MSKTTSFNSRFGQCRTIYIISKSYAVVATDKAFPMDGDNFVLY